MNNDNDASFHDALVKEFDLPAAESAPEVPAPTGTEAPGEQPPAAGTEGEQQVPKPAEGEQPNPQDGGEQQPKPGDEQQSVVPEKQETPEEKANREAEEAANAEPPKPLTPEDIQAAIRADRESVQTRTDQVHSAREEIISKLHPEGIDTNLYDTNGKVIKTAQDIVDRGLINERTGEAFTYEEAASFVLEASKKMADEVENLNKWADNIADQNVSLVESNQRVMAEWGDLLKAMPELAKELAAEYIQTQLQFDETGSYVVRMGMSPEAYYNRVMAPYKQLGQTMADQGAADAAREAQEAQAAKEAEQAERNGGIPPQRGTSTVKSNTGDPFLDSLVDELSRE